MISDVSDEVMSQLAEVTTEFTDVLRSELFTVGLFNRLLLGNCRGAFGFC
jgi:hypothetical protein